MSDWKKCGAYPACTFHKCECLENQLIIGTLKKHINMEEKIEKLARRIIKNHNKTIHYNEGDLDKLEKSIIRALKKVHSWKS